MDRKFRMRPKRQRMILKVKEMTREAKDETKNDTKNETLTADLQEVKNDAMYTCDTKNDTKK